MSFCPICGTNHNPDYLCVERGREALHKAGIRTNATTSRKDFEKLEKKADRYMLNLFLKVIAVLFFAFLVSYIIHLSI